MKRNFLRSALRFSALVMLALVVLVGCKKDEDKEDPIVDVVEDGWYVKGANTCFPDFNAKGQFKTAKNEVVNADRAELMEVYVLVKASSGFNIIEVAGKTQKTYGPGADYAVVTAPDAEEPKTTFSKGAYTETSATFNVEKEGLYHVVLDKGLGKVAVMYVEYWGLIGAATPGGWNTDTKVDKVTYDFTACTATFKAENVKLTKGEMKLRYGSNWKVILDVVLDLGDGKKGVRVNTNLGGSLDALVSGGANIPFAELGFYTVELKWTAGAEKPYVFTKTKTGSVEMVDYTDYDMGIIGNAYLEPGTSVVATWNVVLATMKPAKSGNVYTWAYGTVALIKDGEFKLRQDDGNNGWSGKSVGYKDCVFDGTAKDKFEDIGGNIKVKESGNYVVTFKIDAETEIYTMRIDNAK